MNSHITVSALLVLFVGMVFMATPAVAQSAGDPLGDTEIEVGGGEVPGELTLETDDGTTLVVDGVVTGGYASVDCIESESRSSYCDKEGELSLGPGSLDYEGYNSFDGTNRTGGFGDTFSVMQNGEEVATVDIETQDTPVAAIVGFLGGLGFGIFG